MKPTQLIATLLLLTCISAHAQTSGWQWAQSAPEANGISVVDASGNIYVGGAYSDATLIFGTDTLVNLNTTGGRNIFLVKYNPSGDVIWAKSAGSSTDDIGTALAVDASGNIYLAGVFSSDSLIFGTDTVANPNLFNVFIAKYDSAGNFIHATIPNGTGPEDGAYISALTTDAGGNVLAVGYFGGSAIYFGSDTLINNGSKNVFVVKYDSLSTVVWANSFGGSGNDRGYGVATDAAGNVYATGQYGSPTVTSGSITLTNAGVLNVFTLKYNSGGSLVWARSAGGTLSDVGNGISTDANSNVYLTGYFTSTSSAFGIDTLNNVSDNNAQNIFIARYDSSGNILWAQGFGGNNDDVGNSIFTDAAGNSYLAGNFSSSRIIAGQDTLINTNSFNQSNAIFIAKFDSSGNVYWVGTAIGTGDDYGTSISADASGNAYLTGYFAGSSITFGTTTLTNTGSGLAMFVANYNGTTTGIAGTPIVPNTIAVFPNPSTGQFYFKGINSGYTLEVYDEVGQNIYSTEVTGDTYLLNISSLTKGVYLYRVLNNNDTTVQNGKIILE